MKKNKSVIQSDTTICYLCNRQGQTDEHHIFNGANKDKSDEDGMVIYLHRTCHQWLHEHPISNQTIKARGQRRWEELYGSREDFIKRYGKNYIKETYEKDAD